MAKLSHNLEYWLACAGVGLARALPDRAADSLARWLGRVAHRLLASRRRVAAENLRRAFGEELDEARCRRVVREVFEHIGCSLFEMARMSGRTNRIGPPEFQDQPAVEAMARLKREGKGAITVSAHFGGFELIGSWFAAQDVAMNLLTGVQHNPKVNALADRMRGVYGVPTIPVNRPKRVFSLLRRGEFLALLSDQHAPDGIVVDFFGRPAKTPQGPAAFAVRCGSPILPVLLRRDAYNRRTVMCGEPIYPPNSGDKEADMKAMTQAYTSYFESVIREFPGQWLWTHKRWKVD